MNIYVFNKQFEIQGIVDTFISLIWHRDYYKAGTFELHLQLPDKDQEAQELIQLLQKGNILVKEDSLDEGGYIDDITLDDQQNETLVVTGYFLDNFIARRIVWGQQQSSGTVEEVFKYFVDINCIHPSDTNRVIPSLTLSQNRGISKTANEVSAYDNLADLIESLSTKYDVGWRVLFDLANKQYIFDVYEGLDRSINQSNNPRAIFALEFENVLKQTYKDSDRDHKNVALVAGQGEEGDRQMVTINNDISGFDRIEMFVDEQNLSYTLEDGYVLTDEEYAALLEEQGKIKLAEAQPIQTFESGISVTSNLIYKQDFDLGDIVTVLNNRWGVLLNTRITVVEEVYENDTVDIRVNFGSNIPTIIDKIQQKLR
ncbi:siphovirus ReqiPepy6 Gp37-like family protein [Bacillus smithii]|uniref:siphovirus ReqiPepy6 Gp37-like family protein n=1 Tax=Bacillus smithii TaxID=1479 RepID=UPI002E2311FF|nr:siphovirus ReqiPepy6 Gp37-like family protein [Bacillus smithii]MED1456662.1 siphovirus ReqiPepy6 Gp37-like family protein [Bacillus smithii]